MEQEENIDNAKVASEKEMAEVVPGKKGWNKVVDKLSYAGMVRNMPYLIFLTLLAIIYIANNNHAIALVREMSKKKKEIKELRWRYLDIQSRLMYETSESQLKLKTQVLGLQPLEKPVFEIKIKQKKEH